ncbi:MAG TPA: hypothetical protein VHK91_03760 [Flavisolibacter sp.]|jgi:hypothetical protein|nr:hypothetical protein [Flavisolibacter sp.]
MRAVKLLLILVLISSGWVASAQRIVYSEPNNEETRRMNFEIIGKVAGNFQVYKNTRNKSYISLYNSEMEEISKVEQDYVPEDRLINVDFFPYADFSYMVYQYQKKNVVYCNAVRIDGSGKRASDIITLDTSHIGFTANNKIYSTISNENKSKLMVFKINSRNRSKFIVTTLLFDQELVLQKRSKFVMPMDENDDYLDEFNVDNDGDFIFTKVNRNSNETIGSTVLFWKQAASDTLISIDVPQDKILLDEPHVKVDNVNKRYFLTSFYYKQKRGNVEGFYFFVWDKTNRNVVLQNAVVLGDELRKEAKGDANVKTAFNDYFVRNVIIKRDGGFLINTEAYYTTSRYNSWNRWNYLYGYPYNSMDYYSYSPLYSSWYWRNRYNNSQQVRHHADNITVLSFDNTGKLQWNTVITKEQFDDESDDRISFLMANTGTQLHYFFNVDEKRALLLNDFTMSPDGQINHNPTLKNLDRGYEFLPKYGKQVSAYQMVIPCYYRNYICFAKIEFN